MDADIRLGAKIELARRDFWRYCNLKAPNFYKKDRQFLIDFCHGLQSFYLSDDEVLIVNMPPRHGKSRTAQCFVEWVLGQNQTEKIMTGSYNETLSTSSPKACVTPSQNKKQIKRGQFILMCFRVLKSNKAMVR